MKKQLLEAVDFISQSESLDKTFRAKYGTDYEMVKATIKLSLIKHDAVRFIKKLAPDFFKN